MRSYLTTEELNIVLEEMKTHQDSALKREVIKNGLVAQIVMEEEELKQLGEYSSCDDIYDNLIKNNVDLYEFVENYHMIDYLYERDTDIKNDIKDFLNSIESKLDASFKKLPKDLKDFKLETLVNMLKEDGK